MEQNPTNMIKGAVGTMMGVTGTSVSMIHQIEPWLRVLVLILTVISILLTILPNNRKPK